MGKKSKKTKRKSELKVIFFIILIAAALFIVSTYAWFSTQRNVLITNLDGVVEVAEGLEISLDAYTWSNEIKLGEDVNIMDNAYTGHTNISPAELLPVSTTGKTAISNAKTLTMVRGKVTNSIKLTDIVVMDETLAREKDKTKHKTEDATYPGYFAFDIFLKNSSKQYVDDDNLQLNHDSSVRIKEGGNENVGLQNTVRVAFAKFGTGQIVSGEGVTAIRNGVSEVNASQTTILKETGASGEVDVKIGDVTIWEPNSNDHVEYIVSNNNNITWSSAVASKYQVKDLPDGSKGFDLTTQIPTYAVKETVGGTETEISDIYKWDGTEASLEEQLTVKTTKTSATDYTTAEGVKNLTSVTSTDKPFSIAPNSVVRLRIYVWLEGQDVDCINYASHGGGITVDIGLVKGEDEGQPKPEV